MKTIAIGQARDQPDAVAPDGIPIHLVLCDFHTVGQEAAMGAMRFLGVAEGRVPPGEWGVHAHCSLEQVTFVLEGEVEVRTRDTAGGELHRVTLRAGQAVVTLPAQTLSFANAGERPARVLFICAPPYPADDSDTLLLSPSIRAAQPGASELAEARPVPEAGHGHRQLTPEELERAIEQQERMKRQVAQVFEERIATLRALLASARTGTK